MMRTISENARPIARPFWTRPQAYTAPAPSTAEPVAAPRIWYAYASYGGNPCSIYRGLWPKTLRMALEHQRQFGGRLHFIEERP